MDMNVTIGLTPALESLFERILALLGSPGEPQVQQQIDEVAGTLKQTNQEITTALDAAKQ